MATSFAQLKVPKWPFILGQILLLGLAYYIVRHAQHPISNSEFVLCFAIAAASALVGAWPFLLDYRIMGRQIDAQALGEVSEKLEHLKTLSAQIISATNEWTNVHTQAERTSTGAKTIADRMSEEVRQFAEFMQKMNDSEKSTLRLEAEKARRSESEWLQTTVHIMDHVYALTCAAGRSGQPQLAAQLENFQTACRNTARRMGLAPFVAAADEPFDPDRHQAVGDTKPEAGTPIADTVGTGYTFQGRMLRPAIVKVRDAAPAPAASRQLPAEEPVASTEPVEPAESTEADAGPEDKKAGELPF